MSNNNNAQMQFIKADLSSSFSSRNLQIQATLHITDLSQGLFSSYPSIWIPALHCFSFIQPGKDRQNV